MPGPRQAPTSPQEEPTLLERRQTWYSGSSGGGGSAGRDQQQQSRKDGSIGSGHRAPLLTPHSPASGVAVLAEPHLHRSHQQSLSQQQGSPFISAAGRATDEAASIIPYSNNGSLLRAPSDPVTHYSGQHVSTGDMRVLSGKGRLARHYKTPPAHSHVHSAPPRASGAYRQLSLPSPSPSLPTSLLASAGTSNIRQSPYTAAAPSSAAASPADAATAPFSASLCRSTSSLYSQPGQPASGRYSAPGVLHSTATPAAPQQHPAANGRSVLQQHSSSSSSPPPTSSTSPYSATANSQLTARQLPPTKMQYQYYHQPPSHHGLSGYHQHQHQHMAHPPPPPPLPPPRLYSMPRMAHNGGINNKLGQSGGAGSLGLGISGRPLTAEEKEMKRKVSHSAIEKRRRERTNAVLRELQDIVPGLSKPGKIQKLEILEAAADYIRQLTTSAPEPLTLSVAKAKQRRNSRHYRSLFYSQDPPRLGDYGAASRLGALPDEATERPALLSPKAIDEQHLTITTPVSVSSTASNNDDDDDDDDSADDGTALAESVDACRGSELPPSDPASMKVTFLLC